MSSSNRIGGYVKSSACASVGCSSPSQPTSRPQHARRTARVQRWLRSRLERERLRFSRPREQRREITLHVVKVRGGARVLRHAPLLGQPCTARQARERVELTRADAAGFEARAVLEQSDAIRLAALILKRCAQQ